MPYQITYTKSNELHTLEWICPQDWSELAVRECFLQRFPGSEILSVKGTDE